MFRVRIGDIACIKGQGMVLTGRVERGEACIGARAVLRTPVASVPAVLAGIERNRQIVSCASSGDEVALMIHQVEPTELVGGLELGESKEGGPPMWKVLDLLVEAAPSRWWEFWR